MNLRPGDKITTLVRWASDPLRTTSEPLYFLQTHIASVFDLAPRPGFRFAGGRAQLNAMWSIEADDRPGDRFFEDEGLTWIRGWPAIDSAEVDALRAAFTLGAEEGALVTELFAQDTSPYYTDPAYYQNDRYLDDDFEARGLVR